MRRLIVVLLGVAPAFAGAGQVRAATIRVDFEGYLDGQNLHGINLGGVTLVSPSGRVEVYDNRFGVSYHSATKAVASLSGLASVNPLVGIFDRPVSSVSLWGGDFGTSGGPLPEMDSWRLLAYDAPVGGNLVGSADSGLWTGSPYLQLGASGPSIWRFEAHWTGPQFGMGYDDLVFETISEPPPIIPEPSNASFDGGSDLDALRIDLGAFEQGVAASPQALSIWNLASAGLTADLNLDSIVPTGDYGVLSTNLTPFVGLRPSSWKGFAAFIDTSSVGEFFASYQLNVSDATGAPQPPLTLDLSVVVVPEPSTLVLAGVGLLGLLVGVRRRRKAV